ncbi:hypothetical protein HYT58_00075 [Candidatus Woesearchaeota archaeon]|nr:hypothetical protein [Candidatus Woesearchaeota archaeon]
MKFVAKTIIEVLGSPKEHVEETVKLLIEKAKRSKSFEVLRHEVFPAHEVKDKPFWTAFTEMEIKTDDVYSLVGFCFDFLPSSMEIIEPLNFNIEANQINDVLNDLIARLHQYDMILKNIHAENIILKREIEKSKN